MRAPLGQHFLRDPEVAKTIVAAAELKSTDRVLEIGPGKGALTGELLGVVSHLTAVELDHDLAAEMDRRFKGCERFEIRQGDFLKMDLGTLESAAKLPIKVVGNIPYSITSPIFEKLMPWTGWEVGVFMIQQEVAERIASAPGSRDYGILSLAVQLFAHAEILAHIKPESFAPPPRVTSAVIRLRRKRSPLLPAEKIPDFFDLAHGAFAHRRKTVANSLAFHSGIARPLVEQWLLQHGVSPAARAETLSLANFVQLADAWSIFRRETKLT